MHTTAEAGKIGPVLEPPTDDLVQRRRDALYTVLRLNALRWALAEGIITDAALNRALDAALGGHAHTWE